MYTGRTEKLTRPAPSLNKCGMFISMYYLLTWLLNFYRVIPVAISTSEFETWREKAKLAAKLIEETQSLNHKKLVQSSLRHLLSKNSIIQEVDLKIKILNKLLYLHSKNMDLLLIFKKLIFLQLFLWIEPCCGWVFFRRNNVYK